MRDIRYVVVHAPGPRWQQGLPIFEQDGIQDHIAHFRLWLEQGRLAIGGPFLDEHAGGMMIPSAGLGEAEITAFANADPAVKSGLLRVAVRQWLVGMKQ
jgi:uncharacterized protein YciI